MKTLTAAVFALALLAMSVRAEDKPKTELPKPDAEGWITLYNGKDLTGWNGNPEIWRVVDGYISGKIDKIGYNTFLIYDHPFKDFVLEFKFILVDGKGNSGVQVRSKLVDDAKFIVAGPQADIGAGYWGSLYGEKLPGGMMKASPPDRVKALLKSDDFNDYSVKCVGKHVTIKLNGETMVDGDFPQMADDGIIALQLHATPAPGMEVTFRKIEFKEIK